jgi:hypothetical protein
MICTVDMDWSSTHQSLAPMPVGQEQWTSKPCKPSPCNDSQLAHTSVLHESSRTQRVSIILSPFNRVISIFSQLSRSHGSGPSFRAGRTFPIRTDQTYTAAHLVLAQKPSFTVQPIRAHHDPILTTSCVSSQESFIEDNPPSSIRPKYWLRNAV